MGCGDYCGVSDLERSIGFAFVAMPVAVVVVCCRRCV